MPALRRILSIGAAVVLISVPELLPAEGISLLGDLEYSLSTQNSTEKETGKVTESEFSRFTQLYRLDIIKQMYPKLLFRFGGDYENDDTATKVRAFELPEASSDIEERTIRPYVTVDLSDPLYRANLGYRTRDVQTTRSFAETENLMVDEYTGVFNWRPVDLPQFNINFHRIEAQDDPLTVDSTNDVLNMLSKYSYRDFRFMYSYSGRDSFNHITDSGNLAKTHSGKVDYHRGFDYGSNRFDVDAAARITQNTLEFSGSGVGAVDTPADEQGAPFFIPNDSPPTSNEPFDLILVETGNPLTSINIGQGGGISPVSAGLSFNIATEVATIYIQLSSDVEAFPNLASSGQVSGIASSFAWQFFSSDDQFELNWAEHSVASATYNTIFNRFEIRLASPVTARRIKVTTTPLTLLAPGEIRYQNISAFTTLTREDPESLDQNYSFGIGWSPSDRTRMGYEASYRAQESEPGGSSRNSWSNSVYFRRVLSQVFSTYGRYYRSVQTRDTRQGEVEDTNQSYNFALRGDYLERLSQSLILTGWDSSRARGDSNSKSVLLRTNADLYTGWSMNIDLNYTLNTLENGADQTVKSLYVATNIQPNRKLDLNFDYSSIWSEQTDRDSDNWSQFGSLQALLAITENLNSFFRYSFRNEEGAIDSTAISREMNVNWSPFPEGDLRFALSYSESTDEGNQEIKTLSPRLTWKISKGIFMELRYDTGTLETEIESIDFTTYYAQFRIFY